MTLRVRTSYFVVHCSDTKASQDIGEADIRAWHIERGWSDVGYNIIIRRDGRIEIGRPLEWVGAHVRGHNSDSLGICMAGGRADDGSPASNFTPAQWDALQATLLWLRRIWPEAKVRGHRDLIAAGDPPKACPCFDVVSWCTLNGLDPK